MTTAILLEAFHGALLECNFSSAEDNSAEKNPITAKEIHGTVQSQSNVAKNRMKVDFSAIESLVKRKVDVNATFDVDEKTPLHFACVNKRLDLAKLFVEVGKADVNAVNNIGWTPLHECTNVGYINIMEFLLSKGAADGINVQDVDGETALHVCADFGHEEAFDLLLKHGADPLLRNKLNQTPIDLLLDASYAPKLKRYRRKKYVEQVTFTRRHIFAGLYA